MGTLDWDAGQTLGGDSQEMQELLGRAGCGGGTQHPHEEGKKEHRLEVQEPRRWEATSPPQSVPPMPPGAESPVCLFTFSPFFCCAAPFLLAIFDIKGFIYHPHRKYIFQNYEFVFLFCLWHLPGLPQWLNGKESACNAVDTRDLGSIPGSGRSPWRRKGQPTPIFLPGKSHGQMRLVDYSLWGCRESGTT